MVRSHVSEVKACRRRAQTDSVAKGHARDVCVFAIRIHHHNRGANVFFSTQALQLLPTDIYSFPRVLFSAKATVAVSASRRIDS